MSELHSVHDNLAEERYLALDETRHQAILHGQVFDLTAVEFRLLQVFSHEPGRAHSRSQLMNRIYPDRRVVEDRTIDSHVKNLRRKLALAAPEKKLIHSVYGFGYKFESI
jgi:two-component system, OmpR family, response regulator BaeR